MIQSGKADRELVATQTAAVVRGITKAFGAFSDFGLFCESLKAAVSQIPAFESACVNFVKQKSARELEEGTFESSRLTLPLTGKGRVHGVLKMGMPAEGRAFGPADLHLLNALAGFLATVIDEAERQGSYADNEAVLRFLLNQMPVGIVAFSRNRGLLATNDAAARLLSGCDVDRADELWRLFVSCGSEGGASLEALPEYFYLENGGRLIFGESREAASGKDGPGATAVILTDLTSHLSQTKEALARETYRCNWLGRRLTLLVVRDRSVPGNMLRAMPDLVENLVPGECCGPLDAHSLALVFPEKGKSDALEFIRRVRPLIPVSEFSVGAASLGADGDSPENLLAVASNQLESTQSALRRSLLLHDDYGAVNDMIELILRTQFDIVKSSAVERSMRLLGDRSFDGVFSELDLSHGGDGVQLLRQAREIQPGIRTFLTTADYRTSSDFEGLPRETVVFRKPFDVKKLRQTVSEALPD